MAKREATRESSQNDEDIYSQDERNIQRFAEILKVRNKLKDDEDASYIDWRVRDIIDFIGRVEDFVQRFHPTSDEKG